MFKKSVVQLGVLAVAMMGSAVAGYQYHIYQEKAALRAFFNIGEHQLKESAKAFFRAEK
jgi:hypothetical protein